MKKGDMGKEATVTVIGGGLAGCEAAWQIARHGLNVVLVEMRPVQTTPAHRGAGLAELVCSNSLGSDLPDRPAGLLKAELRQLGSLLLECADEARVPAGNALAVDRERFSSRVTERIEAHPAIRLVRTEATAVPQPPAVVATGPLTSDAFACALAALTGHEHLYFYDAVAPIVAADSINMHIAFRQSRYHSDEGSYINCPMDEAQYQCFVEALVSAERIPLRGFEQADARFFEGCLPIEVLAARGRNALAFGPLRPVGLTDPRTGRRPYAVVQLRQDDLHASLYNMVGFQTNLRYDEQRRVFRLIPGLEQAEFVRLGQMHRNTFVNSPLLLDATLGLRACSGIFMAGQITGIEGYVGAIASGWLAGTNAARTALGLSPLVLPRETLLGALCHYIATANAGTFQPMKANFGLLPPLEPAIPHKRDRARAYATRSLDALRRYLSTYPFPSCSPY